jgi:crossover junction endodeoxyribonuclease RusA
VTASNKQPARAGDSESRLGQVSTPGPAVREVSQGPAGTLRADAVADRLPSGDHHHAGLVEGRHWRIEFPPGMPLLNANVRLHRMAEARIVAEIRAMAGWLVKAAKVPALQRARFNYFYEPPDLRSRDRTNWAPTAKAATDGVVSDAHVLPDDSDAYLVGPFVDIGPVHKPGRLVLVITELLNPSEHPS